MNGVLVVRGLAVFTASCLAALLVTACSSAGQGADLDAAGPGGPSDIVGADGGAGDTAGGTAGDAAGDADGGDTAAVGDAGNEGDVPEGGDDTVTASEDASEDAGEDAGSSVLSCAEWSLDRTQQNLDELHRMGLLLAHSRVKGTFGAPVPTQVGYRAQLMIDEVWLGPTFLEGETVWVDLTEDEVAALTLPGKYVLGFGGNTFPTYGDEGVTWWSKSVIVPADQTAVLGDLQGYAAAAMPWIAVVEIVEQDAQRTRFRVVEALKGDLPEDVSVNWTTSVYAAPFPPVSDTLYIAGFTYLSYNEVAGLYLGTTSDFRPWSEAVEAAVAQAITKPGPAIDAKQAAGLIAFAKELRTAWAFHRAPDVLATEVTGVAGECCTGAGGTYYSQDIVDDLRGKGTTGRLMIGGHAYPDTKGCGDGFLAGIYDLGIPPEPEDAFTCDPYTTALPTGIPVPEVWVELPDTQQDRARVADWLSAPAPLYRMEFDEPVPSTLGGAAPWSQLFSVDQALVAADLALFEVLAVEEHPDRIVVTLETTFTAYSYDHLQQFEVKLAFPCGDERIQQVGSSWLAPVIVDRTPMNRAEIPNAGAFLLPGVVLPNLAYIRNLASSVGYAVAMIAAP